MALIDPDGLLAPLTVTIEVPAFAAFIVVEGRGGKHLKISDEATKADLLALQEQLGAALGQVARMADMLGQWGEDDVATVGQLRARGVEESTS